MILKKGLRQEFVAQAAGESDKIKVAFYKTITTSSDYFLPSLNFRLKVKAGFCETCRFSFLR